MWLSPLSPSSHHALSVSFSSEKQSLFLPLRCSEMSGMVQVPLSAHLQGSAEPAQAAALTLPGPFFLYSSALSQGLWRCRRCRVCLAPQHLPASRSLPTQLPPTLHGLEGVECDPSGGEESLHGDANQLQGSEGRGKLPSARWWERYWGMSVSSSLLARPFAAGAGLGIKLNQGPGHCPSLLSAARTSIFLSCHALPCPGSISPCSCGESQDFIQKLRCC